MALYRFAKTGQPPSEVPWPFATEWSVQASSNTTIRLLNFDGTYTVLHGEGFALDPTGEPIAGTVHSLKRVAADGTVLERISGVNVSLADAQAALDSFGFVDTFLGGNDVVIGTDNTKFATDAAFEVFVTGAGNDIIFGHGGLDVYIDGPGSDLYVGGRTSSNIDVVYDVIDYGNSPYAIRVSLAGGVGSFGSQVTFVGSADVDTLVNFDQVYGTSGNDIFTVDSSFVNKQGDGRAWIGGLGGNDEINGNGQTLIDLADAADAVYVNFALGVARSLNGAPNEDRAGIGVDSFTGVRAVHGSIFDDVLIGSDGPQSEEFMGSQGSDFIDGGGGAHDRVNIYAPPFPGIENIIDLSGPVGFIRSSDANFPFNDTVINIEEIAATEFDDDITMSDVDNVAIGRNGNDIIRGLAGNDTLIGDEGDGLFGTVPGNDILIGGLGRDVMTGNAGADTFDFDSLLETGKTKSTRDVITDFTRGDDLIDLTTIDANALMSDDQVFIWRGEQAFTGTAGQLHFIRDNNPGHANDRTIIEGDVNGDRIADFQIELTGLYRLTDHDFLL